MKEPGAFLFLFTLLAAWPLLLVGLSERRVAAAYGLKIRAEARR